MAKPVLGRGLGALLGGAAAAAPARLLRPLHQRPAPTPRPTRASASGACRWTRVRPCPLQPRKDFSAESLQELADSIKEQGIVQPLIVRAARGDFELIAGERRWRAAQMPAWPEVPVIVREADDRAVLELALIENLQRENLNAIEEAQGYAQLIGQFQLTQEQAAAKVGKSRVVVANALRLLKLAPDCRLIVRDGRLSVGHAKVILGLAAREDQRHRRGPHFEEIAQCPADRGTCRLAANNAGEKSGAEPKQRRSAQDAARGGAAKTNLRNVSGPKCVLHYHQGKGAIEIKFFNDDDLERILKWRGLTLD